MENQNIAAIAEDLSLIKYIENEVTLDTTHIEFENLSKYTDGFFAKTLYGIKQILSQQECNSITKELSAFAAFFEDNMFAHLIMNRITRHLPLNRQLHRCGLFYNIKCAASGFNKHINAAISKFMGLKNAAKADAVLDTLCIIFTNIDEKYSLRIETANLYEVKKAEFFHIYDEYKIESGFLLFLKLNEKNAAESKDIRFFKEKDLSAAVVERDSIQLYIIKDKNIDDAGQRSVVRYDPTLETEEGRLSIQRPISAICFPLFAAI